MWEFAEDTLGPSFEFLTLELEPDAEGAVVATLIRHVPSPGGGPREESAERLLGGHNVLYVHGWADYFFHTEVAEYFSALGANFYALDLRKYGRSLRDWQTPCLIEDLEEYDEDLDAALDRMEPGLPLVLVGHSTGGLVLALWAHRHPGRAKALILNSPWLEFQWQAAGRRAMAPLVDLHARVRPKMPVVHGSNNFYARAMHQKHGGEWNYNLAWKPERGFPVPAPWLRAVLAGHRQVQRGLSIDMPVLTLCSTKTIFSPTYSQEMASADIVLDVRVVAARAAGLGSLVTIAKVDGAAHDVFLSKPGVRERIYAAIGRWLRAYL